MATWRDFAEITGGANVIEVARFWAKFSGVLGGSLTLEEAIGNAL